MAEKEIRRKIVREEGKKISQRSEEGGGTKRKITTLDMLEIQDSPFFFNDVGGEKKRRKEEGGEKEGKEERNWVEVVGEEKEREENERKKREEIMRSEREVGMRLEEKLKCFLPQLEIANRHLEEKVLFFLFLSLSPFISFIYLNIK